MVEDLRLGLLGPALARQLVRLPAGNQEAVLALTRRETLTAQEVSGVIDLLQGASAEQAAFVLTKPREALRQAQGVPTALRDPRLSRAGNWLARHLTQAREVLTRLEQWLRIAGRTGTDGPRSAHPRTGAGATGRSGEPGGGTGARPRGAAGGEAAMNEATRLEIVQRRQQGASVRSIAKALGISRGAVDRVLARVEAQRTGSSPPRTPPRRRGSIIDEFEPILKELLGRYPNLTGERALQELQARGFAGQYTTVRERIKRLRPRAAPLPVPRFETGPGDQAQMDFGVYDIDFVREGRRRVYLFSYLLGYSRRQYLRFVESMDLPTTLREHVNAFHHLGGVARVCLYDNFKAVVLRHDAEGPLYNPKFLAFATHYGFRPQACQVRRPQTKGKVERKFSLCRDQPAQRPNLRVAGPSQRGHGPVAGDRRRRARAARLQGVAARPPRARTAAPVAAPDPRLRHGPRRLSPRQRRGLPHASAELLLRALVVHRPGPAGPHHRRRSDHLLDRPGRDRPPSPRPRHPNRRAARQSRAIIPPAIPRNERGCCGNASPNSAPWRLRSSTACSPSKSRANCKRNTCWPWPLSIRATTSAPPWTAPSASAPSRWPRSAASWRPTPDPSRFSTNSPNSTATRSIPRLREDAIGPRPTSDYQHLLSPEESGDEAPPEEDPEDEPGETGSDAEPA